MTPQICYVATRRAGPSRQQCTMVVRPCRRWVCWTLLCPESGRSTPAHAWNNFGPHGRRGRSLTTPDPCRARNGQRSVAPEPRLSPVGGWRRCRRSGLRVAFPQSCHPARCPPARGRIRKRWQTARRPPMRIGTAAIRIWMNTGIGTTLLHLLEIFTSPCMRCRVSLANCPTATWGVTDPMVHRAVSP